MGCSALEVVDEGAQERDSTIVYVYKREAPGHSPSHDTHGHSLQRLQCYHKHWFTKDIQEMNALDHILVKGIGQDGRESLTTNGTSK